MSKPRGSSEVGYKAFTLRKDGTLGPLFVEKQRVLERGKWLKARLDLKPKGLSHRPGWHIVLREKPPKHISLRGRVWIPVQFRKVLMEFVRPEKQGGLWITAEEIYIP